MKKDEIRAFFARLKEINPEPKCELVYTSDFTLLVAIVLSAQTTDKNVNRATPALFAVADTPEKMVALGEEKIKTHIRSIGLFNTKAKNIVALSRDLIDRFGGKIPTDFGALQTLAGVGRKTANVFLNTFYGQPTIGVDTHVFRLCNRLGLAKGKTPVEVEENLKKALKNAVPDEDWKYVGHWLVLHGRYYCTAKKPRCADCPVAGLCPVAGKA